MLETDVTCLEPVISSDLFLLNMLRIMKRYEHLQYKGADSGSRAV
jgi:hypothetical protein